MKEKAEGERRVEKDKDFVYDVSWSSSPQNLKKKQKKNRYVTGSWKRDEVYRE